LGRGVCGIGGVTLFDTSGYRGKLAAEVRGISSEEKRLSRCDILGLIAWEEAAKDADFENIDVPSEKIGICIGSGAGGLLSAEMFRREQSQGRKGRPGLLVPFATYAFTSLLAQKANVFGPQTTISTACSSSATAVGISSDWIRNGLCEAVITGGSESLSETTFSGFNALRSVDEMPCRPFDLERRGISPGEGAAIFVVEEYVHALKRGARIYAEIPGYGISGDAYHVTAPDAEGNGIVRAIENAFRNSYCGKEGIGYINAHGTGTTANDIAETRAIKRCFGESAYRIPVSSTKSMIGHCLGAAGALEAVAAILPFHRDILPPTVNYRTPDPDCDLDYVPEPRTASVNTAMSLSVAFGGNNTALLLRRMNQEYS
jgi:3-oxoacyl-[acyl-carrier-protein] synthase II